jgi:transcriptional regulator with XRE-family HTH domain
MPRVSKLSLPPLDWGKETIGLRLARIRKERGFTQVELAAKIGIVQTLVTDYETDRLRLTAEMAVRFAMALGVSLDELLHPQTAKTGGGATATRKPSRKVLRRLEKIEELPATQQTTLLRTIDTFLEVAALKTARRA